MLPVHSFRGQAFKQFNSIVLCCLCDYFDMNWYWHMVTVIDCTKTNTVFDIHSTFENTQMHFACQADPGHTSVMNFIAMPHVIYINTGVQKYTRVHDRLYITILLSKSCLSFNNIIDSIEPHDLTGIYYHGSIFIYKIHSNWITFVWFNKQKGLFDY